MEVYTGYGDKGMTDLSHTKNVSKSDDRICLMGSIEELLSHIGLVRALIGDGDIVRMLEKISETLKKITDGVSDPYNREFKVSEDRTELLEEDPPQSSTLKKARRVCRGSGASDPLRFFFYQKDQSLV